MTVKKKQSPGPIEPGRTGSKTPAAKKPAAQKPEATAAETEAELEEALEQTFPASDPVAMQSTLVPGRRR